MTETDSTAEQGRLPLFDGRRPAYSEVTFSGATARPDGAPALNHGGHAYFLVHARVTAVKHQEDTDSLLVRKETLKPVRIAEIPPDEGHAMLMDIAAQERERIDEIRGTPAMIGGDGISITITSDDAEQIQTALDADGSPLTEPNAGIEVTDRRDVDVDPETGEILE